MDPPIAPYLDKADEFFVLDPHIFDRVKQRYSIGEPALHFQYTLPDGFSCLVRPQIFWQEYSNMADRLHCRQ